MQKYLLILLLTALCLTTEAQQPLLRQYKTEHGLAGNTVYFAYQDSKGFIWLATDNGISKFDGSRFINFNTSNGLPDNDVFALAEDAQHRIWAACYNGIPCYIENDRVYTTTNNKKLQPYDTRSFYIINQLNATGEVVMYNKQHQLLINARGDIEPLDTLRHYRNTEPFSIGQYVICDRLQQLFLYHKNRCIDSFNLQQTGWQQTALSPNRAIFARNSNDFVIAQTDGSYFTGSISANRFANIRYYPPAALGIHKKFVVTGQYRWTSFDRGLVRIKPGTFAASDSLPAVLPNTTIHNVLHDREGNYWIATKGEGLYFLPNLPFTTYPVTNGPGDNYYVLGLHQQQVLALGANNTALEISGKKLQRLALPLPMPSDAMPMAILQNNRYFVAVSHQKIYVADTYTGKRHHLLQAFSIKQVKWLNEDEVLVCSHASVFRYHLRTRQIHYFFNQRSTAVAISSGGQLWIGTPRGLYRADGDKRFTVIKALEDNRIIDVECLGDTVLIGTAERGLAILHNATLRFIDQSAGLAGSSCRDVVVGRDGTVWVATPQGISKISNPLAANPRITNITQQSGLPSGFVHALAVTDSTVYCATSLGLVSFPVSLHLPQQRPLAYITALATGRRQLAIHQPAVLQPGENSITISLAGLHYRSLGTMEYRLRIARLHNEWRSVTGNSITLDNLPPGAYIAEVMATDAFGNTSENPARLRFTVQPQWWQTWWLRISAIAGTVLTAFWLIRWQTRRIIAQRSGKERAARKMAELELEAVKAQIKPHFIFNSLNSIQYFISNNYPDRADEYLNRLAKIIRATLEHSGKLTTTVQEEINYLTDYLELEKLRFHNDFEYDIETDAPGTAQLALPPMTLQPHVENALNHGLRPLVGKKHLWLRFRREGAYLVCIITDNGIGRQASMKQPHNRQSSGTRLAADKLELYKKITGLQAHARIDDLYDTAGQPAGTTITITITQYEPHQNPAD